MAYFSPRAVEAFRHSFDDWKSEQNSKLDPVYVQITCQELSSSLYSGNPPVTIENGKVKMVGFQSPNLCVGHSFKHRYDSANYQIATPIIYFQGSTDTATPLAGAKYHFNAQSRARIKYFVEVKLGGHNPLTENLRPCCQRIWDQIALGNFEIARLLTETGWCPEQ